MSERAKIRMPTWLWLFLLALFLAATAGILTIKYRGLPECARPEVIQKRFHEQLDFLKELALSHKGKAVPPLPEEGGDDTEFRQWLERRDAWWSQVEEHSKILDDPAILSASVYLEHSPQRFVSVKVIEFKDDSVPESEPLEEAFMSLIDALPDPGGAAGPGRPSVRRVYTGKGEAVEYKQLVEDPSGTMKGLKLVLDLACLQKDGEP